MPTFVLQMFYDIAGQECSNRFYYASPIGEGSAAGLGLAFVGDVLPAIGAALTSQFSSQIIRVTNIDTTTDFTEFAATQVGLRSPDISNPWDAWGFQLLPSDNRVRKGAKRFAGVADVDVVNSTPSGGVIDELEALAVVLGGDITGGLVTYTPVIYSEPNQSHPETLVIPLTGAIFKRVTTQNSRKPW